MRNGTEVLCSLFSLITYIFFFWIYLFHRDVYMHDLS